MVLYMEKRSPSSFNSVGEARRSAKTRINLCIVESKISQDLADSDLLPLVERGLRSSSRFLYENRANAGESDGTAAFIERWGLMEKLVDPVVIDIVAIIAADKK
jgi:hypothetical protein